MDRVGDTGHLAIFRMINVDLDAPSEHLRVGKNPVQGVDWTTGHTGFFHDDRPVIDAFLAGDGTKGLGECVAVGHALAIAQEPGVLG